MSSERPREEREPTAATPAPRGLARLRQRLTIGTIGWMLLAGFIGVRVAPQLAAAVGWSRSGPEAPDVRLTTLDGRAISLGGLRGQVVLVNFWATWCPPCRVEMPGFQQLYDAKHDQGFTVLGISTDQTGRDHVAAFLRERNITYPVAMATSEAVTRFGAANVLPTSYLLDRQGRIRYTVQGVFTKLALEQAVNRLLAEPADAEAPAPPAGPAKPVASRD